MTRPFAVRAGDGRAMTTPTGDQVTVKADTGRTSGSMTVLEFVMGPKQGPALHTHLREDELWYVLEGEFRFKAGDAMLQASTGGMAFGPRGVPHCFQNTARPPVGCWSSPRRRGWNGSSNRAPRCCSPTRSIRTPWLRWDGPTGSTSWVHR